MSTRMQLVLFIHRSSFQTVIMNAELGKQAMVPKGKRWLGSCEPLHISSTDQYVLCFMCASL